MDGETAPTEKGPVEAGRVSRHTNRTACKRRPQYRTERPATDRRIACPIHWEEKQFKNKEPIAGVPDGRKRKRPGLGNKAVPKTTSTRKIRG